MSQLYALDLFTVGIGPSSSHTVGPMRAAKLFAKELQQTDILKNAARVQITLYGSLGATGSGHGTTNALVAGLAGYEAETCDPVGVQTMWTEAAQSGKWHVLGLELEFDTKDVVFLPKVRLAKHSNGMLFEAFDAKGKKLIESKYFSVGGGFVESESAVTSEKPDVPHPFKNAEELVSRCEETGLSMANIVLQNAEAQTEAKTVTDKLQTVWQAMQACIEAGMSNSGVLPGGLQVNRRAAALAIRLREREQNGEPRAELANEWLQAFAIAVNEENAAGMRVVTAPTNGAAGIIPAVAYFAKHFKHVSDETMQLVYLPTAAAIGSLYKMNASISGAEAGCQGEVGSACSMAAGALTAVLGGTTKQIENAAEIAMEHHLGLTCDPVGGLVQLPCIERNAIAAGTALAASRLALSGDGSHKISLDVVIETMRQTGKDMNFKYKETSAGGLAVNVIEC